MDVSIWWVVAASFFGVWTGILVSALLAISKDREEVERNLPRVARVRSFG